MENTDKEQGGKNERLEQLRLQCLSLRAEARNAYLSGSMAEWAGKTVQSHVLLMEIKNAEAPGAAA